MSYRVILADPPWSYHNSGTRGAALNIYPTMTDADIMEMPVEQLAAHLPEFVGADKPEVSGRWRMGEAA